MNLSPEIKAQLEEQKKQCIFCKIISGETAGKILYRDSLEIGMLDINPAVKGHSLFMPLEHYPILPFLPPETFGHFFGRLPAIVKAHKKSIVSPGATVFIANGGAAGQQSPHFMAHIFPREKGDGLFFGARPKPKTDLNPFSKSLNAVMQEHFSRNHAGHTNASAFLYEDDLVRCEEPEASYGKGHITLTIPNKEFDELDEEMSRRIFTVASYASSILFESFQAHGTNLILHTGSSEDNAQGFRLHLLPRWQDDGLNFSWKAQTTKPNLDEVKAKMRDEFFVLEHAPVKSRQKQSEDHSERLQKILEKTQQKPDSEIERAIDEARK